MSSNLLKFLDNFWEVKNRPKHDLSRVDEDDVIDIQKANLFYVVITITFFTITAILVGGGML